MSTRSSVIRNVTERMVAAYVKGDLLDAQNMNAFIISLETMTDEEYNVLIADETSGLIA